MHVESLVYLYKMDFNNLDVLDILGLVCIAIVAFFVVKFAVSVFYYNFLAPGLGINAVNFRKTGKWAVVTGATDGIGKAFVEALAKKKLDIVLISRSEAKLHQAADEIESKYKVETKIITADFNDPHETYDNIYKQLDGLDIGVLVNNIGYTYPYPDYFTDVKDKDIVFNDLIKRIILSTTNMTKIVLPGMSKRKRGVIINVSSGAAIMPYPLVAVYAAAKSYVLKLSEDLQTEYKKDGVTVQCLLPGYVATNKSPKSPSLMSPSPERYVKSAMSTIGTTEKTTGYFPHTLLIGAINLLDSISPRLARGLIIKNMLKSRAKVLSDVTK